MKITIYTLEKNGTIPEYVVDGGHIPVTNKLEWPQNFDLVGVTTDDAPGNTFESVQQLASYMDMHNMNLIDPSTNETIPNETYAERLWDKLTE